MKRQISSDEKWFSYFLTKPTLLDLVEVVGNDQKSALASAAAARKSMGWVCKHLKLTQDAQYIVTELLSDIEPQTISIAGTIVCDLTDVGTVGVVELFGCADTEVKPC